MKAKQKWMTISVIISYTRFLCVTLKIQNKQRRRRHTIQTIFKKTLQTPWNLKRLHFTLEVTSAWIQFLKGTINDNQP